MQPLNLNQAWYQLDPIACYWTTDPNERQTLLNFVNTRPNSDTLLPTVPNSTDWVKNTLADNGYAYKSSAAYSQAYNAFVNSRLQAFTAASMIKSCPTYSGLAPVAGIDAQAQFWHLTDPVPFDAYFNGAAASLNTYMLRLFVSTPLFTGPGQYSILCSDRQLVQVVLAKRPSNDVFFRIKAKHSGQCLTVSATGTTAGEALVQQPVAGTGSASFWRVEPSGSGAFLIANQSAVFTVNVANNSMADNCPIVHWPWGGGAPNETWQFVPIVNSYYKIVSKLSGKLLTVQGASMNAGAAIVQMPDSGADSQLWQLSPI